MKKTAIKLMILSIILLVSTSSTVLGYTNYATGEPNTTGVPAKTGMANVTGTPTVTGTANVAITTETEVKATTVSTPAKVDVTEKPISPKETSVKKEPVATPKSPGIGSFVSIVVILLAMYIGKRK